MTKNQHFTILDKIVQCQLYDRYGHLFQQADLDDLRQTILIKLDKIIPNEFESQKHFLNWCYKFSRLYSINAIRDLFNAQKREVKCVSITSLEHPVVERSAVIKYWQDKNLKERVVRFSKWVDSSTKEELSAAKILVNDNNSAQQVAKHFGLSYAATQKRLIKYGLRHRKLKKTT